jgi:hypothetical protein
MVTVTVAICQAANGSDRLPPDSIWGMATIEDYVE